MAASPTLSSAASDPITFEHVVVNRQHDDDALLKKPPSLGIIASALNQCTRATLHVSPLILDPVIAGIADAVVSRINAVELVFINSHIVQACARILHLPAKLIYGVLLAASSRAAYKVRGQWHLFFALAGTIEATLRSLRLVAWSISIRNASWDQLALALDEASHLLSFWSVFSLIRASESLRISLPESAPTFGAPRRSLGKPQPTVHGGHFILGTQRRSLYPFLRLTLLWCALRKDQWGARAFLGHFLLLLLRSVRRRSGLPATFRDSSPDSFHSQGHLQRHHPEPPQVPGPPTPANHDSSFVHNNTVTSLPASPTHLPTRASTVEPPIFSSPRW